MRKNNHAEEIGTILGFLIVLALTFVMPIALTVFIVVKILQWMGVL